MYFVKYTSYFTAIWEEQETAGQAKARLARNLAQGFPVAVKLNKAIIQLIKLSDQNISYIFVFRI